MPTPGVLYVATSLTHSDAPSEEKFNHWYNEIHIPDLLKVKGLKTAIRYKNNDPNVIPQFLTLYPLEDLALLATKEFQEVPITHDKTWGKKSKEEVAEIAGLTPRVYATIQKYEPEKKLAGKSKYLWLRISFKIL